MEGVFSVWMTMKDSSTRISYVIAFCTDNGEWILIYDYVLRVQFHILKGQN